MAVFMLWRAFVLLCLACAADGRRVLRTRERLQGCPDEDQAQGDRAAEPLKALSTLLMAFNPAVAWRGPTSQPSLHMLGSFCNGRSGLPAMIEGTIHLDRDGGIRKTTIKEADPDALYPPEGVIAELKLNGEHRLELKLPLVNAGKDADSLKRCAATMQKGEVVRLECDPEFYSSAADDLLDNIEQGKLNATPPALRPPWAEELAEEPTEPKVYEVELLGWRDEPSKAELDAARADEEWKLWEEMERQNRRKGGGAGNSGNGTGFTWKESLKEVTLRLPVDPLIKAKHVDLLVKMSWMRITAGELTLKGQLVDEVDAEECYWVFDDDEKEGRVVEVTLRKLEELEWAGVFEGKPNVTGLPDTEDTEDEQEQIAQADSKASSYKPGTYVERNIDDYTDDEPEAIDVDIEKQ